MRRRFLALLTILVAWLVFTTPANAYVVRSNAFMCDIVGPILSLSPVSGVTGCIRTAEYPLGTVVYDEFRTYSWVVNPSHLSAHFDVTYVEVPGSSCPIPGGPGCWLTSGGGTQMILSTVDAITITGGTGNGFFHVVAVYQGSTASLPGTPLSYSANGFEISSLEPVGSLTADGTIESFIPFTFGNPLLLYMGVYGRADWGLFGSGFGSIGANNANDVNITYGVLDEQLNPVSGAIAASEYSTFFYPLATGPDADGDGMADNVDNCTLKANPTPTQCDSDGDGYGNRCDGDMNNNAATNSQDYVLFRAQLGQPSDAPTYNQADLNCNGAVNSQDYVLFRGLLGSGPGPSGLVP